jgi:hypothetical protein
VRRLAVASVVANTGIVLTGGVVALVLGQWIIGIVLLAFAVWQFVLIGAGRGGLLVDQRAADKPGKPTVSQ